MSSGMFLRTAARLKATVAASATTSDALDIGDYSFGIILIPTTAEGTTLTFTVCDTSGGTYVPLKDADNVAIDITFTSGTASAHPLPPELFAARYFKVVCGTTQTTTSTVFVINIKG